MGSHAARLPLALRARGDDEVVLSGADRLDQRRNGGRIVGAVAIHEDNDVVVLGRLGAGHAGKSVAAADTDHLGAGLARAFLRAVGAAAVDYDHAVDHRTRQFGDDRPDRFCFVECGNDDGTTPRACATGSSGESETSVRDSTAARSSRRHPTACWT